MYDLNVHLFHIREEISSGTSCLITSTPKVATPNALARYEAFRLIQKDRHLSKISPNQTKQPLSDII